MMPTEKTTIERETSILLDCNTRINELKSEISFVRSESQRKTYFSQIEICLTEKAYSLSSLNLYEESNRCLLEAIFYAQMSKDPSVLANAKISMNSNEADIYTLLGENLFHEFRNEEAVQCFELAYYGFIKYLGEQEWRKIIYSDVSESERNEYDSNIRLQYVNWSNRYSKCLTDAGDIKEAEKLRNATNEVIKDILDQS